MWGNCPNPAPPVNTMAHDGMELDGGSRIHTKSSDSSLVDPAAAPSSLGFASVSLGRKSFDQRDLPPFERCCICHCWSRRARAEVNSEKSSPPAFPLVDASKRIREAIAVASPFGVCHGQAKPVAISHKRHHDATKPTNPSLDEDLRRRMIPLFPRCWCGNPSV